MASEANEGWEGGEVLFAGGTDWAKVLFISTWMQTHFQLKLRRHSRMAAFCRLLGAEAARNKVIKKSL